MQTGANLYNMARIFQAYAFMVLTDEYGDIPYTEGGKVIPIRSFFLNMMHNKIFIQKSYRN